jgi:hypothetical protein
MKSEHVMMSRAQGEWFAKTNRLAPHWHLTGVLVLFALLVLLLGVMSL